MRAIDTLTLALRMFQTRTSRTLLTILGVSIGIATVHLLVSIGYGLQETILHRIASDDALSTLEVYPGPEQGIDAAAISAIENHVGVLDVRRVKEIAGRLVHGDLVAETTLSFTETGAGESAAVIGLIGRRPKDHEHEAVLTSAAEALLGLAPAEAIGKTIGIEATVTVTDASGSIVPRLWSGSLMVVGVIDNAGVSAVELPFSLLPAGASTRVDRMSVRTRESSLLRSVRSSIEELGFVVSAVSDTVEQVDRVFRLIQAALAVFGLIALFVSSIGMFNTMTVTLLERTQEIGIMRAIGMPKRSMRRMFLVEAMFMGFLGGVLGVMLSLGASAALNVGISRIAVHFGGDAFTLASSPVWFTILVLVCSTVIGALTGVFPARRASRLNPLDALRYK